jgi:ABC-2 type transport system ATP-binding protein
MESAIEAHNLRKAYGELEAVRDVSLSVAPGEVFCLLGPNGAGKTTTVEMLEGHRDPTSGTVRVLGQDPSKRARAWRDRIGVVLQDTALGADLTVGEILEMSGRWYSRPRGVDELIELVELDAKRDTRTEALSGGQRRRLDLALGLVGRPDVLFLDEPTTGFDPHARRAAWSTIRHLCVDSGMTVVLTTHYMDEAQYLADRVAVMVDGRIVDCGPPEAIGGRDRAPAEIRFGLPTPWTLADLPELRGAAVSAEPDGRVLVTTDDGVGAAHLITGWALERDVELARFTVAQPSLEDVYLSLTETANNAL